jgi:N-carbamoyl-L-amino-acid hydrolase
MFVSNARSSRAPYPASLHDTLCIAKAKESRQWLSKWSDLNQEPTPVWSLPDAAKNLEIGEVHVKDESVRSALGSFKALGAPIALVRLIMRQHPGFQPEGILTGQYAVDLQDMVVISATDGNHGRALAAAAQSACIRCVIVLHRLVSMERETAIARNGAEIVRIEGSYDASVQEAARLAQANGWQVVSDTSYEGYEEIPRDVMQGYGTLVDELVEQLGLTVESPKNFTHVILQGGVGGMAAGVASYLWELYGVARPIFIVVEPRQADCLLQSALQGAPANATGTVDSVMAGLACGETSPLAWRFLEPSVDFFMTIEDEDAVSAMKSLAMGSERDIPIVSGESGAATYAALRVLAGSAEWRASIALDTDSRVLLISTEGATAPSVYEDLVGSSAQNILARQSAWLAKQRPLKLDGECLLEQIRSLGAIGVDHTIGGRTRIALTDDEKAGRDLLVQWMRELQLEVRIDRIGNLFGILHSSDPHDVENALMMGSHIDTVRNAGALDGCYGVLAGLAVARAFRVAGIAPSRPLIVAAFTNEEGVRYQPDMMGSLVYAGGLPVDAALNTIGTDGTRLGAELERIGYDGDMEPGAIVPAEYLELHIEQGPILEAQGQLIGVVENLQGIYWQRITVHGTANHAGTTPIRLRHDAGYVAAAIVTFLREHVVGAAPDTTLATSGSLRLEPDLINVIPSKATFTVDLRDPNELRLQAAEKRLADFMAEIAIREGVTIEAERLVRFEPVVFDATLAGEIEASAQRFGFSYRHMTSGAGHDAQMIARMAPVAMVFVPSRGGISHNPREHTDEAQLIQGAQVLLDVVQHRLQLQAHLA